ncbi:hypothetical protein BTVI_114145 [Pitangus sulphuratus]|nr:hypothetical protein BTVI_114145 [Pitangus sulphuratus]
MVQTMVKQDVTLQPIDVHRVVEIHLQPVEETHAGACGCLRGSCELVGGLSWSRLLAGTCGPTERGTHTGVGFLEGLVTPVLEQPVPEGLHPVVNCCSSLCRTVACGMDSCWRSSGRTVSHGRDPMLEKGKNSSL